MQLQILRRIDKLSLQIFLTLCVIFKFVFKRCPPNPRAPILILADLLLGDLGIAGHLVLEIRRLYPQNTIVLLCRKSVTSAAELLQPDVLIAGDYLNWNVLRSLRKNAPHGYSCVVNIFSWKWLPLVAGLRVGPVIGHKDYKGITNIFLSGTCPFPQTPQTAADITIGLLDQLKSYLHPTSPKGVNCSLQSLPKPNFLPAEQYVILHIGARTGTRLWPINLFESVIRNLNAKNANLVITGLHQDLDYLSEIDRILNKYPAGSSALNLLGRTALQELLAITQHAQALISIDTGVIHWARLMGIPNLSFLGPTDAQIFGARSPLFKNSFEIFVGGLDCRDKQTFQKIPANWIKNCQRKTCIHSSVECLTRVSEDEVNEKITQLLACK
jgi:ADP-heptose:LPS heptosyltransferase